MVVLLSDHRLLLCRSGALDRVYPVALGRGGVGKRKVNDNRTPAGAYALGAPRPSKRFGTFIAIGYPTHEQRRLGFSGGGIGVHGPDRRFAWAGRANTVVDWTRGCIATASYEAIDEIARWVIRERARVIHLEEPEPHERAPGPRTESNAEGQ